MTNNQHSYNFLLFGLIASIVLVFFIAKPFIGTVILAAVFAFLFQPIYKRVLRSQNGRESVSALLTTIAAIVLIILPIAVLGTQIFKEAGNLYQAFVNGSGFIEAVQGVMNQVRNILPIPSDVTFDLSAYARQGLEVVISNFGNIFSSLAKTVLNILVFIMTFYFFLKDGSKLKDYFVDLSPLADEDDHFVVSRLKLSVSAVMKGSLAIGLIQGTLTGVGFATFGVPNSVLWGGVTAISALIPGVGTALVIIPAVLYLLLINNTFGAVGLLIWGVLAVGLIDNLLGPRLVGKGMKLHPLVVFLSVLGGLALFGPLGFLLGPLALSVCLALIHIYLSLNKIQDKLI